MSVVTSFLRSVKKLLKSQSDFIHASHGTEIFFLVKFNDAVYAHQRQILHFSEVSGFLLRALASCVLAEHGRRLEGVEQ